MDKMISDFIESTFSAFEPYHVTDEATLREIDELKAEYVALAERSGDMGSFFTALPNAGLYEKMTALMTKIVMKQQKNGTEQAPSGEKRLPTVREYLEQYREGYNEVKKHPERTRAIEAYERLFSVAEKTDDLLEAELTLERERLAWGLTYFNALDTFENRLKEMDPLFKATTAALLHSIEAVKSADSPEEYAYEAAVHEVKSLYDTQEYYAKMLVVQNLALRLIEYSSLKRDFYAMRDRAKKRAFVASILEKREEIRKILDFSRNAYGLTFEMILADEGLKIWLLAPENADEAFGLGKKKTAMHFQNYDVFLDIIENEIRPEIPVSEILRRKPEKVLLYRL